MRFGNFGGEVSDIAAAKLFLEKELQQSVVGLVGGFSSAEAEVQIVISMRVKVVLSQMVTTPFEVLGAAHSVGLLRLR